MTSPAPVQPLRRDSTIRKLFSCGREIGDDLWRQWPPRFDYNAVVCSRQLCDHWYLRCDVKEEGMVLPWRGGWLRMNSLSAESLNIWWLSCCFHASILRDSFLTLIYDFKTISVTTVPSKLYMTTLIHNLPNSKNTPVSTDLVLSRPCCC